MQFDWLRRREFITLLGGAAAWPLAARAQQAAMPVVGFMGATTPSAQSQWTAAFVQRLRELNWIEGRNVAMAEPFAWHSLRHAFHAVRNNNLCWVSRAHFS
jgi:putative ABC transport system substrate-binding protein